MGCALSKTLLLDQAGKQGAYLLYTPIAFMKRLTLPPALPAVAFINYRYAFSVQPRYGAVIVTYKGSGAGLNNWVLNHLYQTAIAARLPPDPP